jgi:hypothetical protein
MPQVRFEPTIPVFDLAKVVHASDPVATVIGLITLPELFSILTTAFDIEPGSLLMLIIYSNNCATRQ